MIRRPMFAVQRFECTNCGDPGWLPFLAIGIGLASLVVAVRALRYAGAQHEAFVRQITSRARLRVSLTVDPEPDDDGVIRGDGGTIWVRVHIGIKNEGEKAAGPTALNVLIPAGIRYFAWSGPNGDEIPESTRQPQDVPESLPGWERSQYLDLELPRVSLRPHYQKTVRFSTPELPDGGELSIPVRAKVQADELPDEIDEVVAKTTLRFARR
jgi:hypothetical protein